jgi:hypothetical protein
MDSMSLLKKAVAESGQAAVARKLGYSPSAINQVLKGTYRGSLFNLLSRVDEVYSDQTVNCPVMGTVPLSRCAHERKKRFGTSSPQRVRLWRACQDCDARD